MALHLPQEILDICDFSTLRLAPGSFVEDHLKAYYSDVLYSLKTRDGQAGYVQVLIEHQSTPDKLMAFRMLRYAVAAMQQHLDAGHSMLPLVIPVLFYAGRRSPYPYSTRWLDACAIPQYAEKLYNASFPLVDVTVIDDDAIRGHGRMAALTLVQKHIAERDLAKILDPLISMMEAHPLTRQQIVSLINYLIQTGKTENAKTLMHKIASRMPHQEGEMLTIAQQLEEYGYYKGIQMGRVEGINQGIEQGIEQGKEEGIGQGVNFVARRMLDSGYEMAAVAAITGLSEEALQQLAE